MSTDMVDPDYHMMTKTAARNYRCSWCGETIPSGEVHSFSSYRNDEYRRQTHRNHVECQAAVDREIEAAFPETVVWHNHSERRGKTSWENNE